MLDLDAPIHIRDLQFMNEEGTKIATATHYHQVTCIYSLGNTYALSIWLTPEKMGLDPPLWYQSTATTRSWLEHWWTSANFPSYWQRLQWSYLCRYTDEHWHCWYPYWQDIDAIQGLHGSGNRCPDRSSSYLLFFFFFILRIPRL